MGPVVEAIWTPGENDYFCSFQAQQPVPDWLEKVAFGAHGTTGYNPRGGVFASTDSRKVRSVIKDATAHRVGVFLSTFELSF